MPIYTCKNVVHWLDLMNVDSDSHLLFSPGLNVIKHVWGELKRQLHEQFTGISNTKGGFQQVNERLAQVLPRVWETVEPEFFEELWISISKLVEAVIQVKGWHSKY